MESTSNKVTPLQAWNLVTSIKLHFEGKLDAVKYRFSMKSLSAQAFEARKDRYFFEKLARRHSEFNECLWYVSANVMAGKKWIGSMNEEPYIELRAYHESMQYRFSQEIKSVVERFSDFDDMLEANHRLDGVRPPPILAAYSQDKVSIHGLAILQTLTGFLDREMPKVNDPLGLWTEHSLKARKYAQLLARELHIPTYRQITIDAFTSKDS